MSAIHFWASKTILLGPLVFGMLSHIKVQTKKRMRKLKRVRPKKAIGLTKGNIR